MKKKFTLVLLLVTFFLLRSYRSTAQVWRPIASIDANNCCYFDSTRSNPVVTMGPNGTPYMLYQTYNSNYSNSVYVVAYNGSAWVPQGNQDFAPSYPTYPDIHVAAGKPIYVGLNGNGSQPDVWAYSGTPWHQVSPPPDSPLNGTITPVSITMDATGKPWYAIYNSRTNRPSVYTLNNGVWAEIGAGSLGNGTGGKFVQLVIDNNNTPYIAYDENNPSGGTALLVVERYNNGGWTKVGTTTLYSIGSKQVLTFDGQNNPYVLAQDPTSSNSFRVLKFAGTDWAADGPVIAPTDSIQSGVNGFAQAFLAMGQQNTPLVCYWSNTYYPSTFGYPIEFIKLDNSAWVPAADTTISLEGGGGIAFAADTLGHAVLAYLDYNPLDPNYDGFELFPSRPKPVIAFNPIYTVYGSPDFSPDATSNNTDAGDPITYSIADTTVATLINGKIHILKAGQTTITASQAADNNYVAADPVTVQLYVGVATQTMTFPGWPQKKVGDPDFAAGAYASSGLPVTYEGSDPTIATVSPDGTIHIIEQGAINVTAHQYGDTNYLPAPDLVQVLIINAADTAGSDTANAVPGDKQIVAYCTSPSSLLVQVTPPGDGSALLEVFNSSGSRLYSKQIVVTTKGNNINTVPVGNMPEGIYFVRVVGNGFNMHQTIWIR